MKFGGFGEFVEYSELKIEINGIIIDGWTNRYDEN